MVGVAASVVRCEAPEGEDYQPFVDERCLEGAAGAAAEALDRALHAETLGRDPREAFTDDGVQVFGRSSAASSYDVTLDVAAAAARIVALGEIGGGGPMEDDGDYQSGYRSVEVRIEGDEAHVTAVHMDLFGSGEDATTNGVEADLRREGDAWRVARLRQWPLEWITVDEGETYDEAHWTERDRAVARARVALGQTPTAEARRALGEALFAALRGGEVLDALQPSLDAEPNIDDLAALARVHALAGRLEEARAAYARSTDAATPIQTLATYMRRNWCRFPRDREPVEDSEGDEDYDRSDDHCDFEVLADLPADGEVRGVGVVRVISGPESMQSVHLLTFANDYWNRGAVLSEGPFEGNQTDGVTRIAMSEPELVDLDGAAPPELRMRYERDSIDDGDETRDAGFLLCTFASSDLCGFVPTRITREADGRTTTEYAVTFTAGRVSVRRQRGAASPAVREGAFTVTELLTPR